MLPYLVDEGKFSMSLASSSRSGPIHLQEPSHCCTGQSRQNVLKLLALREISPRTKRTSKRQWGVTSRWRTDGPKCEVTDARQALTSWLEAASLRHLSAKYCPLQPPPRSTIAAAFSSDGQTLASTHGDHTVKIIDCKTGTCLKVLKGHRRTPWVVRFHPFYPNILASGSLDHEVRLWNAQTADCIASRDFYRPIASISFHALGELLAVACGHKLYIWHYNRRGEASSPAIVLKTKRSLRAVHFHPHAAPYLFTAEVNDLDSSDSTLTSATCQSYVTYPPPVVFFATINSTLRSMEVDSPLILSPSLLMPNPVNEDERTFVHVGNGVGSPLNSQQEPSQNIRTCPDVRSQENLPAAMDSSPSMPSGLDLPTGATTTHLPMETDSLSYNALAKGADGLEMLAAAWFHIESASSSQMPPSNLLNEAAAHMPTTQCNQAPESGQSVGFSSFSSNIDLPEPLSTTGTGQSHAGLFPIIPANGALQGNVAFGAGSNFLSSNSRPLQAPLASLSIAGGYGQSRGSVRAGPRSRPRLTVPIGAAEFAYLDSPNDEAELQQVPSGLEVEIHSALAAENTAELPCTVKLRIWYHHTEEPCAPLEPELCRLTIPHAVLCSEMGAHFSSCGRFLAACVACLLPRGEGDPELNSHIQHDSSVDATSPTRHPFSAHQVIYELRIYSLENSTFGLVLASRAIRAAHCLTSIQFSPTSEHVLLAYGRRHSSLLRSIVVDGENAIPVYTVLEVYRASDMELVKVLPSAEDEVNVACFHPMGGGGLVYGTKEGKLRILRYDGRHGSHGIGPIFLADENALEGDGLLTALQDCC